MSLSWRSNELLVKWWRKCFRFHWTLTHLFSSCRRDWVRISKREKRAFVNITIYPMDELCRSYDPRSILEQFIKRLEDNPPTMTDVSGFCNDNGILSLRTNCSLVRNAR